MAQHKLIERPTKEALKPGLIAGRKLSVIGLGYVGLMIAAAFAKRAPIVGLDVSVERISALQRGFDVNGELSSDDLALSKILYTSNPEDLMVADFHIIAVPTPLGSSKRPDLRILLAASETVGKYLKKGDIVVYESSVYPGATEEICIPVLEKASGLVAGRDFGVGYSPERINPADKEHTLSNIPKIVSAIDKPSLEIISEVYNTVVKVGTYHLTTIRAAEATKVIENIQRDLNISLVNEVALILHSLNMDSTEVFEAMKTKWNHLPFKPGLVGGHCIPVNSYYLAHKAEEAGYHPNVILAARHLNEKMPKYIVDSTIKQLIKSGHPIKDARIAIFGLTYKENTPDVHDTPAIDMINELKSYNTDVLVYDPIADRASAKKLYGIDLCNWEDLKELDAIIFVVAHDEFKQMDKRKLLGVLKEKGLVIDVKSICNQKDFENSTITLWRL